MVCGWDSVAAGLIFSRPTGLVAQISQIQTSITTPKAEFQNRLNFLQNYVQGLSRATQENRIRTRLKSKLKEFIPSLDYKPLVAESGLAGLCDDAFEADQGFNFNLISRIGDLEAKNESN